MDNAGWWVGLGSLITIIGGGLYKLLGWYLDFRKLKTTETIAANSERRIDEKNEFQRLSDLFDSERAQRKRLGRNMARLRKRHESALETLRQRCENAEKNEVACRTQLNVLQADFQELKTEIKRNQLEGLKLMREQNEKLRTLVGEAEAQTLLQTGDALDKILEQPRDPDDTVKEGSK